MNIKRFPQTNNIYYFIDRQIIILKIFMQINMAKVKYLDTFEELVIDLNVLSSQPINEISISIKWLGGADQ